MTNINWETTLAAIWRSRKQELHAVTRLDTIQLDGLLGIDHQKEQLSANIERFVSGLPAQHILLWGSRGTGKSSLIKAALNHYHDRGLRLLQLDQDDLDWLPELADDLREAPYYFLVFCDDLSFSNDDNHYKHLKSVMDGSIELPPENIILCTTSNRRHLMPENMQDNLNSGIVDGELHYADNIEETISLSDRFGLRLSFYPISQPQYLDIIDHYCSELYSTYQGGKEQLYADALLFARSKGHRSGRVAKQFFQSICS